MWFKRHKKSEQDHALSESLRSLQSLLSETGRREPSLDPGETTVGDSGTEPPADPPSEPRPPRASNPGGGARPQAAQRDSRTAEPGTPDSTGNRWRDLNLSFDAEPVLPRARRDRAPDAGVPEPATEAVEETHTAEADSDDGPHDIADKATNPPVADEADHTPLAGSPEVGSWPEQSETPEDAGEPALAPIDLPAAPDGDDGEAPVHEPGTMVPGGVAYPAEPRVRADAPAAAVEDEDEDTDPGFRTRSDEEVLVLDLEEPGPSPAETGVDEADETGPADEPDDPAPHAAAPGEAPASEPPAEPGQDEQTEDQLHLELEPDGDTDSGIPVLTNAVYVPDTPAEPSAAPAFAPPGPAGSPHDDAISRCIDNLRVRFQLMGLEALSPAQEKELHDALAEFLDDFQHD